MTPAEKEISVAPAGVCIGPWIKFRLGLAFALVVLYFLFIISRLVGLQVVVNPELQSLAERQFFKTGETSPHRLAVYDRNREELAVSIPASSVFARPRLIRNRYAVARQLSRLLGEKPGHWLKKLKVQKPFVWLERQVSEDTAKRIVQEDLPGVFTEPENKRVYPNGPLAANVLGFTNVDGIGISGLELSLDEELLERGAKFAVARDGKGNPSYIDKKQARPDDDGNTGVYITLDRRLQQVVEEELEKTMGQLSAKGVMAVVMNPSNGEILAMGQRPTFDPNRVKDFPSSLFPNRVISSLYEPGSTMKVVMAASALESGLLTPASLINCEHGKLQFGKIHIHDAEAHGQGIIPLSKVIQVSSNIGAVKIADTLGVRRVRETLDEFGLTSKTGVSLPGEISSPPKPDRFWLPIFLATVGFGQGVSVTPLQMVTAFAPFANGGYLVRPRILLREGDDSPGGEGRRILSPNTAAQMKEILIGVTESKEGTGKAARIPNVLVAGKTGTAQKYEPGVGYAGRKFFSSFIGFLPADRPQLLIGVFVDEPKGKHLGGEVAAPVFRSIAERSLQILDRAPKRTIVQPDAVIHPGTYAQAPKPQPLKEDGNGYVLPDLKGVSMREALRLVGSSLANVKIVGDGYIDEQFPRPGTLVHQATPVTLHFSPRG